MLSKPAKKAKSAQTKKTNPDIYRFIDFFVKTGEKILGKKPEVVRGKDGKLVSYALRKFPVSKLETLAVWFLAKKKKLKPLIGTMLSLVVLNELMRDMDHPAFWKNMDDLMDRYYPRRETPKVWQPFSYEEVNIMKEEVAKAMRRFK